MKKQALVPAIALMVASTCGALAAQVLQTVPPPNSTMTAPGPRRQQPAGGQRPQTANPGVATAPSPVVARVAAKARSWATCIGTPSRSRIRPQTTATAWAQPLASALRPRDRLHSSNSSFWALTTISPTWVTWDLSQYASTQCNRCQPARICRYQLTTNNRASRRRCSQHCRPPLITQTVQLTSAAELATSFHRQFLRHRCWAPAGGPAVITPTT